VDQIASYTGPRSANVINFAHRNGHQFSGATKMITFAETEPGFLLGTERGSVFG